MVMRESFEKSESEGSKPGFYDHQQTALKEFMVFNTNSVILPHIIEQALRQRALGFCKEFVSSLFAPFTRSRRHNVS